MLPDDLLKTAAFLVHSGSNRPRQADLRRAVSTAYYAMFHALAKCGADSLVGSAGAQRSDEAWKQAYRALDHGFVRKACDKKDIFTKFPSEIQDFANLFLEMQVKRHKADYDPNEKLFKSAVLVDINRVESVVEKFKTASLKDRRAFAIFVLLRPPRKF